MFNIFDLFLIAKDFSSRMQRKNIDTCAGSTSFFLILSLIPLLVFISSLLPYTTVTERDLSSVIIQLTPDFANGILLQMIDEAYSKTFSIISISAIITIWSGAWGMLAIIRGLNSIYEVTERRNYIVLRITAIFYTIALIITVLLMLVVMVFGKFIRRFLIIAIPHLAGPLAFLSSLKFLIVIGGVTFVFALIYTYVPNVKLRLFQQLPGALFSAVVWYVFSLLFGIYVNHTDNYNTLYGSLATPVIVMFWLYFCIYIFFIGAFINNYLHG